MRRTTTSIGGVEDGYVPNIKGSLEGGHNFLDGDGQNASGALSFFVGEKRQKSWAGTYNSNYGGFNFDASRSNSAYINDNLVIPRNLNIGGWLIKYI